MWCCCNKHHRVLHQAMQGAVSCFVVDSQMGYAILSISVRRCQLFTCKVGLNIDWITVCRHCIEHTGVQYAQNLPARVTTEGVRQLQAGIGVVCKTGKQLLESCPDQLQMQLATSLLLALLRVIEAVPSGEASV